MEILDYKALGYEYDTLPVRGARSGIHVVRWVRLAGRPDPASL